ncbi:MAG: GtrA family protein [Candidatus Nomurabacteria bacterium]|nr:MAG: GtrA family protein [Candidatus Nomurabacteria bacterium]
MTKSKTYHLFHVVTKRQPIRFALVGVANTAVDFGVLFGLTIFLHVPVLAANIVSTSVAMAVSYLLNKRAVFRDTDIHNRQQVMLFVVVTLTSLWVLQGFVLSAVTALLWVATNVNPEMTLLIAKLTATAVSLMWNYTLYSRVVFKNGRK